MHKLDFEEVKKRVDILNVAYHLCLEIEETRGTEYKAICPFCGYNKNSKIATMALNTQTNQYCCSRCGEGGFSIGLYAKVRGIDNKKAYRELLDKECFSQDKTKIEISPINVIADVEKRDTIYRRFLGMLRLELQHKNYLKNLGLLDGSIDEGMYKSIPSNKIKRRLICNILRKEFNLCGIPGFYQEEDFKWTFSKYNGFFVPVFDDNGYIQELSIHLDKPFNGNQDIWFSSGNKINGTSAKNWIMKSNIYEDSKSVILTDNFILGNLIKETMKKPVIAFQNISNSYNILKVIEKTSIKNITFILRANYAEENIDYIIRRVFRDLIPLGYELDVKTICNYSDIFEPYFWSSNNLQIAV